MCGMYWFSAEAFIHADNIADYDLVGPEAPPPRSGLQAVIAWVVNNVFGRLINLINPINAQLGT